MDKLPPAILRPRLLLDLMQGDHADEPGWTAADLGDLWRLQLQAKLADELGGDDVAASFGIAQKLASLASPIETFENLFHHSDPPLELLRRVKTYAQDDAMSAQPGLPQPIAAALYNVAALVARARHSTSITSLPDVKLREALRWTARCSWVDEPTRELVLRYSNVLGEPGLDSERSLE